MPTERPTAVTAPTPAVPTATTRARRRTIFLLRGLCLVAVGGLFLDAGTGRAGFTALALLLAFGASNAAVALAPSRLASTRRWTLAIGAVDVGLVGLGIVLAGTGSALAVCCLLMVLVIAMASERMHAIAGATAVGALHAWLVLQGSAPASGSQGLVLQTLFLCSVGMYYGFLTEGLHVDRKRQAADELERRELEVLLSILDDITSSLDPRDVLRAIVTKVTDVVPAVRCSMLLASETSNKGWVLASHDDPALDVLEVDLERYPEVRRALETREAVLVEDVANDPIMAAVRQHLEGREFHSILVLPLTFAGDLLGTLALKTARAERPFTEREVAFCKAVARASANALKNTTLHRQVLDESTRHRRTAEKLASILDQSPELILTTDTEGVVTELNRGAERLLGVRRDDVVGRPCTELLSDDAAALTRRVLDAGALSNHSRRLRHRDGGEVEAELNLAVLRDDDDRVVGTVWAGRDVSELKAAQLQLVQAEKLSSIGEVIAGVAHELNNPLSGVIGYSELLAAEVGPGQVGRELDRILEAARRCQKIVKNLLSFARAHAPERHYLGLNGIVQKTLDLVEYQLRVNDVEVVVDLDEALPPTMLDFNQMQQVLLNLVSNAQQAMAAVPGRGARLVLRSSLRDSRIRLEVGDNGAGIDAPNLERIFDPFFTTKEPGEGTGLGLSVSYGIVQEHGGRISARSQKGVGTTFVVELPVLKTSESETEHPAPPPSAAVPAPPVAPEARILVVDDEAMILDLLFRFLGPRGFRVDTAANGREACRKLERGGAYDLVLTDMRMPRLSGRQLHAFIAEERPDLAGRVVFITGDLLDRDTLEFLEQTQARSIAKPLSLAAVLEILQETLQRRPEPVPT